MRPTLLERCLPRDPRDYQIAVLSGLLLWGVTRLGFDITWPQIAITLAGALAAQWLCTRAWRLPRFEPRSALISGLSLCLLLRTDLLALALAGAALAIVGKFALRRDGKHLFNPTNFGLVALILTTGGTPGRPGAVWLSPGQWGDMATFAFLMCCVGFIVSYRAARSDVTLAFLGGFAALLMARALWLGQPWATPLHQLRSGSLLLFAFFMISDPRTTPDSRRARVLFGLAVAAGAATLQFALHRPNGAIWSLAALSPIVPLLDRWLPGRRHEWPVSRPESRRGASYEIPNHPAAAVRGAVAGVRA